MSVYAYVLVCVWVCMCMCVCVCMIRECFEKGCAKRVAFTKETNFNEKSVHHKRLHFLNQVLERKKVSKWFCMIMFQNKLERSKRQTEKTFY
jgi:hypothetical protein